MAFVCSPAVRVGALSAGGVSGGDPFRTVYVLRRPVSLKGAYISLARGVSRLTWSAYFKLPANATRLNSEGGYIVDAWLRVRLRGRAPRAARAEVSVATNGLDAGTIAYQRKRYFGLPATWWGTNELFQGFSDGVTFGRIMTVRFRDYLVTRSVKPGRNRLSFEAWQYFGNILDSVEILSGSRIAYGPLRPARVNLRVSVPRHVLAVGDMLSVQYFLTNSGFPARNVGVVIGTSGWGLSRIDAPGRFVEWLTEGHGVVRFQALAPGTYTVSLGCAGATGTGGIGQYMYRFRIRVHG